MPGTHPGRPRAKLENRDDEDFRDPGRRGCRRPVEAVKQTSSWVLFFILVDFRMILRFGIKSEAIDEYKNQTWGNLFLEKF